MKQSKTGFATRAIHHGHDASTHHGALNPPVYMTSTFAFQSVEQGGEMFAGEREGHFYTRISNPTLSLLETRLADLEGGEAALATASGMGAICAAIWTLIAPGDEIITDGTLYGCTFSFFRESLQKFGITITHVDLTEEGALEKAISDKTKVVYFETPANPNMRIVDIEATAAVAKHAGATVIVDNTYCTPYLQQPLSLGADLVVHSATKYLGGHGDLIAGAVVGSAELIQEIRLVGLKDMTGAVLSPQDANLILRGLKTLELRMERHCDSAEIVTEYLAAHPMVTSVYFPGLESFKGHEIAKKQMARFGGMIPFEVEGGLDAATKLLNSLKLIQIAVSLGDAETLIQHPASMTHSTYTPEERAEFHISDGLIRLSVGLEHVDDVIADLDAAFDATYGISLLNSDKDHARAAE
ncbi:methionine gamma-lyase [Kordiimonas aquimaris]|uniref:methionine gamma-lyase n=1 Tax=Kordiimonas aquimaris TaxID=707591 RepID=UPI0021CF7296|nr:methionine gamma-lyase [Kordiimonas aquimaris]